MYLDFETYQSWGGTLPAGSFDRFCYRAGKIIDAATHDRIAGVDLDAAENAELKTALQRCTFELVAYIGANENSGAVQAVSHVSNDGYSVTYAGDESAKTAEAVIGGILRDYLVETDLLYAGVDA